MLTKSGHVVHVVLSGDLTVRDAMTLYCKLFADIDSDVSLVIEAEGVTRMDGSIAQLIVFASRCVREVRVEGHSAEWDNAFALLGLHTESKWQA
jgi:anti-anti-sigma regulatory factor